MTLVTQALWPEYLHCDETNTMPPPIRFRRYDARPVLARGADPCGEIFARVRSLKSAEGLVVTAPFLPSPLIDRLAGQGFASEVEHHPGRWMVYFWEGTD